MRFTNSMLAGTVALAVGCLGTACPAVADSFQSGTPFGYDNYNVLQNTGVTIVYTVSGNTITNGYFGSGQIQLEDVGGVNGKTDYVWCVDVYHDLLVPSGQFYTNTVANTLGMSNVDNSGGALTAGYAPVGGANLTWSLLGELGAVAYYGNVNANSSNNISAAVQLAIWKLEYGANISLTSDSATVQSLANSLVWDALHGRLGSDTDVDWLTYCVGGNCNQGQLLVLDAGNSINDGTPPADIPEPSTLLLLGSLILSAGGFAAWRRRQPAKQVA